MHIPDGMNDDRHAGWRSGWCGWCRGWRSGVVGVVIGVVGAVGVMVGVRWLVWLVTEASDLPSRHIMSCPKGSGMNAGRCLTRRSSRGRFLDLPSQAQARKPGSSIPRECWDVPYQAKLPRTLP